MSTPPSILCWCACRRSQAADNVITVTLQRATLRVADNDVGFDPTTLIQRRFGLGNMQQRAQEIGAAFKLAGAPRRETQLRAALAH